MPIARPVPRGLFVMDLDGTLLDARGELPPRNLEALRRACEAGVALAVVTGRRRSTARRELPKLEGVSLRLATSNGSVLLGPDHSTVESALTLDWAPVRALAADPLLAHSRVHCITLPPPPPPGCAELVETFLLAPGTREWHESETPWEPETYRPSSSEAAFARALVHVAFVLPTREEAETVAPSVHDAFSGAAAVHAVRSPRGEGVLLEAVAVGGKGNAVRQLVELLGVAPDLTAAVGDDMNDGALLDAVRHRFAVGGSILASRRRDAVEVETSDEGAVAGALSRFLARIA